MSLSFGHSLSPLQPSGGARWGEARTELVFPLGCGWLFPVLMLVSQMLSRASVLASAFLGTLVWGWGAALAPALAAPPAGGASTTPTLGTAMQPSTADQLALVEHLRLKGVVFYGAWWCPACFKQKNLFGEQAGNQLPYVECEKTDAQRERCSKAGIGAYPTWVMGSQKLEGVQTLEALGRWSGFAGGLSGVNGPTR